MANFSSLNKLFNLKPNKPFFPEKTRKTFLLNIFSVIGFLTAGFYSVSGFLKEELVYSILLLVFAFLLIANLLYLKYKPAHYKNASLFSAILMYLLGLYLFTLEGVHNTGALWHFAFIPIAFFIIGKSKGLIFSLCLIITTLLLYYFYFLPSGFIAYPASFINRYIFVYLVITSVTFVYEYAREKTNKALEEKQKELNESLTQTFQQNEEIKAQSEMLAKANKELERYAIVASKTDNCIVILDLNGNFEWVNEAFQKLFNNVSYETQYTSFNIFDFSSRKDIREIWNKCLTQKKSVNYESHYFINKNKKKHLQTTLTPIIDNKGNISKIIIVESDISELKKAEKQLILLNKTLESRVKQELNKNRKKDLLMLQQNRLAAMGEMISNIAHQWRQPLNAIGVIVQNIQEAYEYKDISSEYLEQSVDKTMDLIQYMSQTIEDFQHFFRPDKAIQLFEINQTITKAINFVQTSFKVKNISIEANMPETVIVKGYPNEYIQVIINILNNARDALLDKTVENPVIKITLTKKNNKTDLRIFNNGPEINEDISDKIFDPYFSTKEVDKGTGLGLYMAKNIIEKNMHGKIFYNNTDGGVEFVIQV